MAFLHFLESFRSAPLDAFFGAITYLGDEIVFICIALLLFWCWSKRCAYYVFFVGSFSLLGNQFLKIICRVPRPWVLDPSLTIVESARSAAQGYSFPSGHTQDVVSYAGSFALLTKKKWAWIVCAALVILVPFSRLYLGVHSPSDVGAGFLLSAVLVLALYPVFRTEERCARLIPYFFGGIFIVCAVYLIYVLGLHTDVTLDESNYFSAVKNGWLMTGCLAGLALSYFVDRRWLHFEVQAKWYVQILKFVLGFVILIALRAVLKEPMYSLFHGNSAADAVRYFIMVAFSGCVWPLTFPLFRRLEKKKEEV